MAITTTREQRRRGNHEGALATHLKHHAAAVALVERIQVAVANHDTAPDPEAITWATVGSMEKTRGDLQALSDWLIGEGEYAEAWTMGPTTEYPMAARCRAMTAQAHLRIRALHAASRCRTWEAWSEPFRDADDRRRTVLKPVHGCHVHGIWISD